METATTSRVIEAGKVTNGTSVPAAPTIMTSGDPSKIDTMLSLTKSETHGIPKARVKTRAPDATAVCKPAAIAAVVVLVCTTPSPTFTDTRLDPHATPI